MQCGGSGLMGHCHVLRSWSAVERFGARPPRAVARPVKQKPCALRKPAMGRTEGAVVSHIGAQKRALARQ
jgi:hypothetical protein